MALLADFKHSFGTSQGYYRLRSHSVDHDTGAVGLQLQVYRSAAARAAFKAASAEVARLGAEMRKLNGHAGEARETVIELEAAKEAQLVLCRENSHGTNEVNLVIPAGEVERKKDGSVSVADIYGWLKQNKLAPAQDA